jgi:hypothetical protein
MLEMSAQQSLQPYEFDFTPLMKSYLESIETWKKSYETLAASAKDARATASNQNIKSPYDSAFAAWQKSGEELFKRFVEQQIEICRFLQGRWEQYLKLPEKLSQCQSPSDVGSVQTAFFNQFANDYLREAGKLSQPMGQLLSNMAAGGR